MRERSDTWHEMRRIHKGLSNMNDCKHDEINLVRTELMNFCTACCSTICLVSGAVRDRHGKVTANITTPEWVPSPPLLRVIALIENELEAAKDADDGTEDLERALSLLNMLRRKEGKALDVVFERLNVLAKGELDKAQELLDMVKESAPHTRIDRDLNSLAGLAHKAMLRQKVGHAYLWAIQDIKTVLGLPIDEDEFSKAVGNHPTELDQ